MAAERQSMPDLREFQRDEKPKEDRFFERKCLSQMNITVETKDDDTRIKEKTKKRRLFKSKKKVGDTNSPRLDKKKKNISIAKHVRGWFSPKRIKSSYKLPKLPQEERWADESKKYKAFSEKNIEEKLTPCEPTCECECVKHLERQLLQVETEKSEMRKEMMDAIEWKTTLISELKRFAENERCVVIQRCKNLQVGDKFSMPQTSLEPILERLDDLCELDDDVKKIAKDTQEKVVDLQNSLGKDRTTQVRELIEKIVSARQDPSRDTPVDSYLQQARVTPDISKYAHSESSAGSPRCVVWGRTDVIDNVIVRQDAIFESLCIILRILERSVINGVKPPTSRKR